MTTQQAVRGWRRAKSPIAQFLVGSLDLAEPPAPWNRLDH